MKKFIVGLIVFVPWSFFTLPAGRAYSMHHTWWQMAIDGVVVVCALMLLFCTGATVRCAWEDTTETIVGVMVGLVCLVVCALLIPISSLKKISLPQITVSLVELVGKVH